ncbi:hypothetical protein AMS59_06130 [Lysinibacillus sp. FJAT-14745]|nr:hypothetical protein AMS59_06130 [Lysinibacillus sp. FJAT-14745]
MDFVILFSLKEFYIGQSNCGSWWFLVDQFFGLHERFWPLPDQVFRLPEWFWLFPDQVFWLAKRFWLLAYRSFILKCIFLTKEKMLPIKA